jgi:hypothetical protein
MRAGPPGGPPWPGDARVTFEWLEGAALLVQHWHIDQLEAPDGEPFSQRFTGTFSDDKAAITGRWEIGDDGKTWRTDFDLTCTRVGGPC